MKGYGFGFGHRRVGNQGSEDGFDLILGQGAGEFLGELAIGNDFDRRDALDLEGCGELLVVVNVDLSNVKTQTDTRPLHLYLDAEYRAKVALIEARKGGIGRLILLQWAALIKSDDELKDSGLTGVLLPLVIDALVSPKRTFEVLLDNVAIAIFVFLPVYALVLKLFYLGVGRRYYIEHLVFSMHLHSVGFIVFTALSCLALINTQGDSPDAVSLWLPTGLVLAYFVYHYLALIRYYRQSWLKTSIKFAALTAVYGILLGVTMFSTAAFTLTTL